MDLAEEVRRSEKLLGSLLRENIKLEIDLPDDPGWVLADAAQLHQILVNLAVNAQDAMATGGVLKVRVERVLDLPIGLETDDLAEPSPHLLLTIADTGDGIPESVLPHIFEPFFTTKSASAGTGLGLSTV